MTIDGVLDGMIIFIEPYTSTQFGTTGNYGTIAILHIFQSTVARTLEFSVFTSRVLATDLSQSHCNFKSQVKSSLHRLIIPCLPFPAAPNSEHSTQFSSDYRSVLFLLLCFFYSCSTEHFLINILHGPRGKHRLLLSRMRVYWSVT
jgi:hypothetical protein